MSGIADLIRAAGVRSVSTRYSRNRCRSINSQNLIPADLQSVIEALCSVGVFLYPSDGRDGYEKGRLRMVYECAPIAFPVEQAGGKATDAMTASLARLWVIYARALCFRLARAVPGLRGNHEQKNTPLSRLLGPRARARQRSSTSSTESSAAKA